MPQIRPITELGMGEEISKLCHARREPVFFTKDGYGDMVVMSMELYESLVETAAQDTAILESEAEYARTGTLYDAQVGFDELRRKHFG